MRFLHTSDLHIGKTVCGFSMLEEQRAALDQILSIVRERQVDAVFLSGDLYDRALPPSQAVTLLDDFLTRLVDMDVLVCAIAGNHDSGERIEFASRILEYKGLYMEGTLREQVHYVDYVDRRGDGADAEWVRIHLLPYAKPAQVRDLFHTETITYEECMQELLKHVNYLEDGKNILLAHQFVVNRGVEPELSDSEMRVSVGGADQVEAMNFSRFDYVALGHIHGPQQIGDGPVYYSGSPVKYSFSEVHHNKSVVLGEWTEQGELVTERIPLSPIHDMRKIRGKLADLIDPEVVAEADEQDYLLAVLTNEEDLVDAIGTLRSVYPNIMQMQIERERQQTGQDQEQRGEGWKEKSPYELFEQFYSLVMDTEMTDEQKDLVREVVEQAKEGGE